MKKLLHIIATPRGGESRTLQVSKVFLEALKNQNPGCEIDTLDLFKETLPALTVKRVDGKYILLEGKDLTGEFRTACRAIVVNRPLS